MGCMLAYPRCSSYICGINTEEKQNDFHGISISKVPSINDSGNKGIIEIIPPKKPPSAKNLDLCFDVPKVKIDKQIVQINSPIAEVIPTPVLNLTIINKHTDTIIDNVILTPNSIKNKCNAIKVFHVSHKFSFGKDCLNDCVINDNSIERFQFYIFYLNKNFYFLDNFKGTGIFAKIEKKFSITKDAIVSFVVDHMFIQVKTISINEKDIIIKFNKKDNGVCEYSSNNKKIITIGRNETCDICYPDDSISKIQCSLQYEDNDWVILDGSYKNNKQRCSTNGIW